MGSRGTRKKTKEIAVEHCKTKLNIHQFHGCQNCPLSIYADSSDCITYGVGNIFSNIIFVLPNYDTNARIGYNTILNILSDCYKTITGNDILENAYITRLVKCYDVSNYDVLHKCIKHCFIHLNYEIMKLNPNKIIFMGDTHENYIQYYNAMFLCKCYDIYSPAVMYYDNNKLKQEFMNQLNNAINDS